MDQGFHCSHVTNRPLTLKAPTTTAADDNFFFFFFFYFLEKTRLEIPCESSACHLKCQDLFSLKNKKKEKFRISSATNFAWHFKG